jgi:hypothetical protein
VFRIGDAVFTSTSHSVSACAGMGSCVFGSTWNERFIRVDIKLDKDACTHLFLLEHLNHECSASKDVSFLVYLRASSVRSKLNSYIDFVKG